MNLIKVFLFISLFFGLSIGTKAQSESLDNATMLDLLFNGPLFEKGHFMLIYGKEKGKISKTVIPGIQSDPQESLLKYCKDFGYSNCRVENEYETNEYPREELLENLSDTKHYLVRKGEKKAYKVVEVASDSKGPEM